MSGEETNFLSVAQAALKLGVTRGRVNQLIKDGTIPARRIGRSFMILGSDLSEAESRNTKPTGRPPKAKENTK